MSKRPKLHLDADCSRRALHKALLARGYDVSRTPSEWIALDASDREQLTAATARGRVILTFNIADFSRLGLEVRDHSGILLANQRNWRLKGLIDAVSRMLEGTTSEEWVGQVRWLNGWREDLV